MDILIERERKARLAKDDVAIGGIFMEMLSLCQSDDNVIALMSMLSKKKGQLKGTLKSFIRLNFDRALKAYSESGDRDVFIRFCRALLSNVIEGRIFLEEECLVVTTKLKEIYEEMGDYKNALDSIINVPVETFSSIDEPVVIQYQIEQLRLSLMNRNLISADATSKRIRKKYFSESGDRAMEELYYKWVIRLLLEQERFLEASKMFSKTLNVGDPKESIVLSSFFVLVSNKSEERDALMTELIQNKENDESVRTILRMFLKDELISYDVANVFKNISMCEGHMCSLFKSIDFHNLLTISKFCTTITFDDIVSLLGYECDNTVEKICDAVNSGVLKCKIDQGKRVVRFNKSLDPDYSEKIDIVLDKIIEANYLIRRENMKYNNRESDE